MTLAVKNQHPVVGAVVDDVGIAGEDDDEHERSGDEVGNSLTVSWQVISGE